MQHPPRDILIVGSGAFGLGTAWALTKRPFFANTRITVVDDARGEFPPQDCASVDSSRIEEWRRQGDDDIGGQGRYSEAGLLMTAYQEDGRVGRKTAWEYTQASFENVKRIAARAGAGDKVRELRTAGDVGAVLGMEQGRGRGRPGDWGYVNELSGWADAGRGMAWLYGRVEATGRVGFVDARVEELVTEGARVVGVKLGGSAGGDGGDVVRAEVVIVAAGAWTGGLVDLRGRVEATAQPLGYVDLSEEEFRTAATLPTVLNFSSGLFIIPPRERVLKVARHMFGYLNPVTVERALPPSPSEARKPIVVSRPVTVRDLGVDDDDDDDDDDDVCTRLPKGADQALRQALMDLTPLRGLEDRPWRETRLCWYADTCDGDWLVDWHPGWNGLFVATGDSGHAYKFLPVLGDKIVDCLVGKGGALGEKWKWKDIKAGGERGCASDQGAAAEYVGLMTDDGSRGGEPGLILREELAK
ncbi:L-pipecolate oxidase [Escovopsis weberi]|uniref:L-pipecolate oxidase n=1 Tax=Escovopsis weberi TaxID=150374 RepID=A0A0M8N3P3_ESCWE|nr:L-pipecolate oxidase [Escovopsis weberi]